MFPAWSKRVRIGMTVKLMTLFLLGAILIFAPALAYHYYVAGRMVITSVKTDAGHLTDATVQGIERMLAGVSVLPEYMADILEREPLDRAKIEGLVANALNVNSAVFGSTISFEPGAFDPSSVYFAPYARRENGETKIEYLGNDSYKYHELDWYLIPKQLDRAIWSEPYYDEGGGNITMTTYSVPFYRNVDGIRKFAGIVTVDISLDWLEDMVSKIPVFQTGYAFIIARNGLFLSHPDADNIMRESIFSVAEEENNDALRAIGKDMLKGSRDFIPVSGLYSQGPAWLYYAPLPSAGWALGLVFPQSELYADLRILFRDVIGIGLGGLIVWAILVALISMSFTKPLRLLSRATAQVATGDLDAPLPPICSRDEVGDLASSFEQMRVSLKDYIASLTKTTAAKERIESELNVAHSIQMSFLHKIFPPFPVRKEFSLYATLTPAKEVGGDLYDFSLVGDHHLHFCIGDVSDKGVPAALFMSVTQTLIRGVAQYEIVPDKILAHVNDKLSDDNESLMFVTAFSATLDYVSGEMMFSNAGHNPPLIVRADGTVEWLKLPDGLVLGVMPNTPYSTMTAKLNPGDVLFTYTDGVTEAMSEHRELFSEERLYDALTECADLDPKGMADFVLQRVREHVATAPQSDDITILAIAYHGAQGEADK